MIAFQCPQCGKAHNAPESLAGKQAQCECGQVVLVPQVAPATPPSQLAPFQDPSSPYLPPSLPTSDKPTTDQQIPPYGRLASAGVFAVGVIAMGLNHLLYHVDGSVYLFLLFLGPPMACLGLGGLIEPKIAFSAGKYGTHLSWHYKLIAAGLLAIGVVVAIALAFYYLA